MGLKRFKIMVKRGHICERTNRKLGEAIGEFQVIENEEGPDWD